MSPYAVRVLERAIPTLPPKLSKGWEDDKGDKCGAEHVHSVIVEMGLCICASDDSEEKIKCIASLCGVGCGDVLRLMLVNDHSTDAERRGCVENELNLWLSRARAAELQQLSLFETVRANIEAAATVDESEESVEERIPVLV